MTTTGWIRGPVWDTACLAFCWVPFYLWFVHGLRLDDGGGVVRLGGQSVGALSLAILTVLALTYVHRHYTFVLVYGDRVAFAERARAYLLAPLLVLGTVLAATLWGRGALFDVGGVSVSGWALVLVTSGSWNVWHTVQQRYGILRIYGGRAGGGLETRAHASRDHALVWSLVALVAVLMLAFRTSTFVGHPSADDARRVLEPWTTSSPFRLLALGVSVATLVLAGRWLGAESRAKLSMAERAPRLAFLASTVALLLVFLVHGPVVGYLCFGTAHALEYVAFVHHFGERKFRLRPTDGGLAGWLLRRPLVVAPFLIGGLGAAYLGLQPYAATDAYLAYYVGSSMLHFLYDGWIWKVRRKDVAEPLGARPALA